MNLEKFLNKYFKTSENGLFAFIFFPVAIILIIIIIVSAIFSFPFFVIGWIVSKVAPGWIEETEQGETK